MPPKVTYHDGMGQAPVGLGLQAYCAYGSSHESFRTGLSEGWLADFGQFCCHVIWENALQVGKITIGTEHFQINLQIQ